MTNSFRYLTTTKKNNIRKLKLKYQRFRYPVPSCFPIRRVYYICPLIKKKISLYFTAHTNEIKKFLFTSISFSFPHWCCCCFCYCHYWLCVIYFAWIQHDFGMVATMNSTIEMDVWARTNRVCIIYCVRVFECDYVTSPTAILEWLLLALWIVM